MISSDFPNAEVIRVIDGDTLIAEIQDVPDVFRHMSIRIKGVDTPELRSSSDCEKKDAQRAKAELERLLSRGRVTLLFCESDKYYRLACHTMVGDLNLSEHLIAQGFGVPYSGDAAKIQWRCK